MAVPSIENTCFWMASASKPEVLQSLCGDHNRHITDIAVIGGGFTGLWTAYFLKSLDPTIRVCIVEKEVFGYGASGRNAGMVAQSVDQDHTLAIQHFGVEEAKRLARIGAQNYRELAAFAADCDFEDTGWLHAALIPQHIEAFEEHTRAARKVNATPLRILNREETHAEVHSPRYIGGALEAGGQVNPIKIVHKLKREVERMGVRIFERTKVERISGNEIRTSSGSLKADRVVLATDAFGHLLFPRLSMWYTPLYDYIIVSEPLTDEQLSLIGWKNRRSVMDARTFYNYYRLTKDNRVLWGSSRAKYHHNNDVGPQYDFSGQEKDTLEEDFAHHFPQLKKVSFPYAWGGPIAATSRLGVCFGSLQNGTVLYALGYTGQGVSCSRFAGKVLAHTVLKRRSEITELDIVKRKPFPYPPEPLKHLAIEIVSRELRKVDQGKPPGLILKVLDALHIGFSS